MNHCRPPPSPLSIQINSCEFAVHRKNVVENINHASKTKIKAVIGLFGVTNATTWQQQ